MGTDELLRRSLHGFQVQGLCHPVAGIQREGIVDARIENVVAVGFFVGGVAGMESFRHRPDFQRPDIRRQMGVERGHDFFRRNFASIAEAERETPRMNARIGAGTALYIGAAAQRGLHGVLQNGADRGCVGLHLKPRVVRALIGDPQKVRHHTNPGTKKRVETMMASAMTSTTVQRRSVAVNRSCLSRVRPSPPW